MGLQAVSLSFKVRITTCRCRGHSGMCVVEKEDVGVGRLGTPCTGQRDASRKRARTRSVTLARALSELRNTPCTYMRRITDTGSNKKKRMRLPWQASSSQGSLHAIMHHASSLHATRPRPWPQMFSEDFTVMTSKL
jgi:hypothetical protein